MKIFVDTANLNDIKAALDRGFVSGVTTNPSLLSKEPKGKFEDQIGKIVEALKEYNATRPGVPLHLSVEVFSRKPEEILSQAEHFKKIFDYGPLSIKCHVGWDELAVINKLARSGVYVNCTACMSASQAVMGALSGARYVSLFWGRIRDCVTDKHSKEREELISKKVIGLADFDPFRVVRETRKIFEDARWPCEIIVGSIRSVADIRDAMISGAHIVTVPPKFFPEMTKHFKTDEVVNQFFNDFSEWMK